MICCVSSVCDPVPCILCFGGDRQLLDHLATFESSHDINFIHFTLMERDTFHDAGVCQTLVKGSRSCWDMQQQQQRSLECGRSTLGLESTQGAPRAAAPRQESFSCRTYSGWCAELYGWLERGLDIPVVGDDCTRLGASKPFAVDVT